MPKDPDEFDLLPETGPWPAAPRFTPDAAVRSPIPFRLLWSLAGAAVLVAGAALAKAVGGGGFI